MAACPACAETLPAEAPERCPSCGERLVPSAPRAPDPPWRPTRRQVVVALLAFLVTSGGIAVRRARTEARLAEAARLLEPAGAAALPSSAALHARVGDRWTLQRASIYEGPASESWDVLQVGPGGVLCRVQPDGGPERREVWRFEAKVRRPSVVEVTRETLLVAGRPIDCDVVVAWDEAGFEEKVWLWIAMDRVAGSPTFPGVVRRDMEGDRGRGCRELEVTSVAPIGSP